jgi:diadenosine tetraphosphate (Ap4A) HIT family hydrolase
MTFTLHPNLKAKIFVADLPLSTVLLEDESHYPWILLVPRRPQIKRIMDLEMTDQVQLIQELDLAQKILWNEFQLDNINVAAIGNKTPQLHIHVIGRFTSDPAWPLTVWDHPKKKPYTLEQKEEVMLKLHTAFS